MTRTKLAPTLKGSTPRFLFTLLDDLDPRPQGWEPKALDLTSAVLTLKGKKAPEDATVLFNRTCTLDADPTVGKAEVRLTTTDTATTGAVYCELTVSWSAGARSGQKLLACQFQMQVMEAF